MKKKRTNRDRYVLALCATSGRDPPIEFRNFKHFSRGRTNKDKHRAPRPERVALRGETQGFSADFYGVGRIKFLICCHLSTGSGRSGRRPPPFRDDRAAVPGMRIICCCS
jgi:hypothetical protein